MHNKRGLALALTVLILTGCNATTATQVCNEDFNNQASTAKDYITTILSGDYTLAASFAHDTKMQEAIHNQEYLDLIKPNLDKLGDLKEIQAPLCETGEGTVTVSLPIKFSEQSVNFNVTFNAENQISAVTITKFSGK